MRWPFTALQFPPHTAVIVNNSNSTRGEGAACIGSMGCAMGYAIRYSTQRFLNSSTAPPKGINLGASALALVFKSKRYYPSPDAWSDLAGKQPTYHSSVLLGRGRPTVIYDNQPHTNLSETTSRDFRLSLPHQILALLSTATQHQVGP